MRCAVMIQVCVWLCVDRLVLPLMQLMDGQRDRADPAQRGTDGEAVQCWVRGDAACKGQGNVCKLQLLVLWLLLLTPRIEAVASCRFVLLRMVRCEEEWPLWLLLLLSPFLLVMLLPMDLRVLVWL